MSPLRTSLRLNNDLDPALYAELAAEAERVGFDQIWVSNDLFLHSAPALAASMLERTERISVGIGILNPFSIHPAEIAMLASTLDQLHENRFLLGLAAGGGGVSGLDRGRADQAARRGARCRGNHQTVASR